ncbi:MAG: DUF3048 domain-containing protein [Patescibacteria group bacterium]|nr:DUF3048 domain-containing protein [Patescibacteria group bacterium]
MTKISLFLLIIVFSLILFLWLNSYLFHQPKIYFNQIENQSPVLSNEQGDKQGEGKNNRLLDGSTVERNKESLLPVTVILENLSGAPKPNLSLASIIYEVPVEGGVTRFLAIFDLDNLPENLGPIRSARSYFAEIAEEYKALFIHAGGSADVLFKLKQGFYKLFDLNEISWQGKYFYRSSEPAPHNLYIKKESIEKFLTEQKINPEAKFAPWLFEEKELAKGKIEKINLAFSPIYQVKWQYDSKNNEYQYWQNGKIYLDKDGQELRVKNLILQYIEMTIIDAEGRRKIKLTGQGEARVFQNGHVINSRWLKEAGRTRFYDENGKEIKFLPGKSWLGIISKNNRVNY